MASRDQRQKLIEAMLDVFESVDYTTGTPKKAIEAMIETAIAKKIHSGELCVKSDNVTVNVYMAYSVHEDAICNAKQ